MKIGKLQILKSLAVCVAAVLLITLGGCGSEAEDTVSEANFGKDDTWVIYWYLCGSDLESQGGAATTDLQEMMQVTLPENVKVVIQTGGASAWQNDLVQADCIQRYEYSGSNLELKDETEQANMGDPETLKGFLQYANENYEADHKMLLFWNHGGGSVSGVAFDENYEADSLLLDELKQVMQEVYADSKPFELVGFDTCLMATLDTANVFKNYASYMVASEETEPGNGWLYSGWLGKLAENPGMNGTELGKEICDSFVKGCEEVGTENEITLSVTDLSKTDAVVQAVKNMGKVVLKKAGEDTSVCAEFARSAKQAENYGGNNDKEGYTNMVDLGHLSKQAEGIIGESKTEIESALSEAVVYKVNGKYRKHASGLSIYYSYNGDTDSAQKYAQIAAEDVYSSFVNYSIGGEVSAEILNEAGTEQISQVEGFSGELPISINDEGYITLNLNTDELDSVQSVAFNLAYISDDKESIVFLGSDNDLEFDWEKGVFQDNFQGLWGSVNGNLCFMELTYEGEDYNLYSVPIMLNKKECYMSVAYDYESEAYYILGATSGVDESGQAGKDIRPLKEGDKVAFIYYGQGMEDDSDVETVTGDSFKWKNKYEFEDMELPDGQYAFLFEVTDILGQKSQSDVAFLNYKDGNVEAEIGD